MCAQEFLKRQRSHLVSTLGGGSVENFENVLDYLIAWDVLTWEDYENVSIQGQTLCRWARNLLDIIWSKGERSGELLGAALQAAERGSAGLDLALQGFEDFSPASKNLQKHRPLIVRKIHGHVQNVLIFLLDRGFITRYECDEIQLPIYTPSQQARRLLDLVKAKGNEAARCLFQHIQRLEDRSSPLRYDPACLKYQRKLKTTISAQSRFLSTYDGAGNLCLEDVYTENVLETVTNAGGAAPTQSLSGLADIFAASSLLNKDADTVLVSGEAGSGKSTLLQHMHLLWATGKAFPNFSFIFPFSCRRLHGIEKQVSLKTLLFEHCCWPDHHQEEIFLSVLEHPDQVLLTFDGFDEFKFAFDEEERHCSPTDPTRVQSVFFNLIQGNLLKNATKVLTSRPSAITASLRKYVRKEVTVKGFSQEGIEFFMKKHHNDPRLAQQMIDLVKANSSLHGLCHIPVFCWIVSKCHKELILSSCSPRTITDMYLLILQHFLLHSAHEKQREDNVLQKMYSTIKHLGKLAFDGLGSCCYVFSLSQLREAGVTEEDVSAGFLVLSKSLSPDDGASNQQYEFLHITFQCFFVALYITMNDQLSPRMLCHLFNYTSRNTKGYAGDICSPACFWLADQEENTLLQKAEVLNLQITATFLAGLLSRKHCALLLESWPSEKLPKKQQSARKYLVKSIQRYFKSIPPAVPGEKKSMHAMPEFIWLIKCLYEMQDANLAKSAISKLEVEHLKLTYCGIGPVECTALAFVLKYLKSPVGLQLDYNSVGDLGVQQLLPCLNICQALYLRDNNISDSGICALIDQAVDWKNFQKIALFNNHLTDGSAYCFANLLKQKQNFLALRLWGNKIGDNGAQAIAEVLHDNRSLIWLSLVGNDIGNIGAQSLALMLEKNTTLEELCLEENRIVDEDAFSFARALYKNSALKVLKLSNNGITERGVLSLLKALEHNCSVTSVWLRGNALAPEETEKFAKMDPRLSF
ncbi:nucleotide-binding oligomerization domain-containing protein 2 isoform X2 [Rhinatrema bivittatum]|uniref:nucleotide-binding oligomerization domain-containing protein 2 isoform X2 n=1 Tax=Rhinatrema bivittatum TaxID=194408 RepID=UPI001129D5BE|nr:nucleotide-binding oligomerization domain-containing protein 2 isoform X2 [Rhinatrema bivittatum]